MRLRIAALVLVLIALSGGVFYFFFSQGEADHIVLYGNVDVRQTELAFRQPGRLAELMFDEGDIVPEGAVMARIDAEPYEQAVALAAANVRSAEAALLRAQNGARPQEIDQAREQVAQTEAVFENANRQFQRVTRLAANGNASQSTVDEARAARDAARANLAAARQSLDLLLAGTRPEDLAAAEAQLDAARVRLDQAETALEDTRLIAPREGVVLARIFEAGAMLNSATPVYSLSVIEPVYVRAYASEEDLGFIYEGAPVRIYTDSFDNPYEGQVGFISPRAEFTPRSVQTTDLRTNLVYRLRIIVTDADRGLRQGMPVTIRIDRTAPPEPPQAE